MEVEGKSRNCLKFYKKELLCLCLYFGCVQYDFSLFSSHSGSGFSRPFLLVFDAQLTREAFVIFPLKLRTFFQVSGLLAFRALTNFHAERRFVDAERAFLPQSPLFMKNRKKIEKSISFFSIGINFICKEDLCECQWLVGIAEVVQSLGKKTIFKFIRFSSFFIWSRLSMKVFPNHKKIFLFRLRKALFTTILGAFPTNTALRVKTSFPFRTFPWTSVVEKEGNFHRVFQAFT